MESIEGSLKRIGTEYLDIYYCHRYDPETPLEETVRAMDDLVHQGKILYWGTSEWRGAQIAAAVGLARQYGLYKPQVEQPGYNLFRRERVENEVLPVTESNGIGLTTFSPLASGLLTGKYDDGVPEDSRMARNERMRERFTDDDRDRVRRLKPIAETLGITRAQLALAWLLSHPGVSSVITGATKVSHIEGNVKATDVTLDQKVLSQVEDIFAFK
jgi:aryl-alcohol dehydrogenase-like predicted oxidoreductase